jgi:hypothetical protein
MMFKPFDFIVPKMLNYFQSFDFERTSWRLFQKRVMCTKFDIYVFITKQQDTIKIYCSNRKINKKKYFLIIVPIQF